MKSQIRHLIYEKHTRIIFNDNNILGSSNWEEIFEEVIAMGKKVDFNQGLDARLISENASDKLATMKFFPALRIAYDFIGIGKFVQKAIERLRERNFNGRHIFVYILFNYTDTPEDFLTRVREVLNWGAVAYPMRYTPLNSLEKNKYIAPDWTFESLQKVQRARRVIGFGGAFPPYEGLIQKLNKASGFDQAFELNPIDTDENQTDGVIEHSKEMVDEGSEEHFRIRPKRVVKHWSSLRMEDNWRLIGKKR